MPRHILSFAGLYERFDEQNGILNSHTAILREMTDILRRIEGKMGPR